MGQFYTVQSTNRLDGSDNYGNVTDSVRFENSTESVLYRHQPTTQVDVGTKLFGHIEQKQSQAGKAYYIFKREQQEQTNFTQQVPQTRSTGRASYKDNSEGMRQGMCINNAANLVNALVALDPTSMTTEQWAKDVHAYASALYRLGDLVQNETVPAKDVVVDPTDEQLEGAVTGDMLAQIDELFPGAKAA